MSTIPNRETLEFVPQIVTDDPAVVANELEVLDDSYRNLCDHVGAAVSQIVENAAQSDMFESMRDLKERGEEAASSARHFIRNITINHGLLNAFEGANWILLALLSTPHIASVLTCVYALLSH